LPSAEPKYRCNTGRILITNREVREERREEEQGEEEGEKASLIPRPLYEEEDRWRGGKNKREQGWEKETSRPIDRASNSQLKLYPVTMETDGVKLPVCTVEYISMTCLFMYSISVPVPLEMRSF